MKTICCLLGLLLLNVLMTSASDTTENGLVGSASCQSSPTHNLMPDVVAPMTGTSPAWMVDGSATWAGEGVPQKTLWVLRRTSSVVRISARRLDAPGSAKLRYGSDTSDTLFVANPSKQSVIPGGASPTVMQSFVFLPSHVMYPSPGCWEFTVQIAKKKFRIVREIRAQG